MKFKKLNIKSYYVSLLKSFLIILIIPLITIFTLFGIAEQVVKKQILLSNQNTLNQFFKLIDVGLEEVSITALDIAFDSKCQNYTSVISEDRRQGSYRRYLDSQSLAEYVGELQSEIFLYYPSTDQIISSSVASVTAEEHYRIYYEKEVPDSFEEYESILTCDSRQPVLYVLGSEQENPLLCAAMKRHFGENSNKNFVIVQVLKNSYLNDLMTVPYGEDDCQLLILDDTGEVVRGSKEIRGEWQIEEKSKDILFDIDVNGNKYMIQVRKTDNLAGYYGIATSFSYFWKQLYSLRIACISGSIICTIVSFWFAIRMSKRNYRPIDDMVNKLSIDGIEKYKDTQTDEFEWINKIIQQNKIESDMLKQKIKRNEQLETKQFIMSVLENGAAEENYSEADFQQHGLKLRSDSFLVAMICVDKSPAVKEEMQEFIFQNILSELHDDQNMIYLGRRNDKNFILLINMEEGEQEKEEMLLKKFQKILFECGLHVTIAVGTLQQDISEIHVSYEEALMALEYKFLYGEGSYIEYEIIAERTFYCLPSAESKLYGILSAYIKERHPEQTPEEFVAGVLQMYSINKAASMDTIRWFLYDTVSSLSKCIVSVGGEISKEDVWDTIMRQQTLEAFETKFTELISSIQKQRMVEDQKQDICSMAMQYIEAHFAESQLSVAQMGEVFEISAWYLSKMFKDRYQISIPDCISKTRIQAAKKQLLQNSKNISTIAKQNGFISDKAFIVHFKKWEGITPGSYRELNRNKKETE